ncbi:MAG TPA: GFA family protein [Rhizomicrobium sp.]|jgi:hypothetical protein
MTDSITGGCLCGAVRYAATGAPRYAGYCCCDDCQKASGSGFIPFMGFPASAMTITGAVLRHRHRLADGREAVRNSCAVCGSLVYGGIVGVDASHTIYAGTLDDVSVFKPAVAINVRYKPDWVILPDGLPRFEGMPG